MRGAFELGMIGLLGSVGAACETLAALGCLGLPCTDCAVTRAAGFAAAAAAGCSMDVSEGCDVRKVSLLPLRSAGCALQASVSCGCFFVVRERCLTLNFRRTWIVRTACCRIA